MLVKRDLYQELGGFDENCFMYSDDVDLSYRMLQGKSNYYYLKQQWYIIKVKALLKMVFTWNGFRNLCSFSIKALQGFSILFGFMKTGIFFFVKMFQGRQRKKDTWILYLYSSTDELISKMESKLQNKVFFHDLKTEKQ
jgi:GT2 family glycosyltransferase